MRLEVATASKLACLWVDLENLTNVERDPVQSQQELVKDIHAKLTAYLRRQGVILAHGCRYVVGRNNIKNPVLKTFHGLGFRRGLTSCRGPQAADVRLMDLARRQRHDPGVKTNVDVMVLLSGDGDFLPLVREWQDAGFQVWGFAWRGNGSYWLRKTLDQFATLDSIGCRPLYSRL